MKTSSFVTGCLLGLLLVAGGTAVAGSSYLPGSEAKWRIYRSSHFELFSQTSETTSRAFLHNMELLHALFFARSGETERQPKPLTIFYFKRRSDYAAYRGPLQQNAGAIFQGGADRSVILLAEDSAAEQTQSILYRAYIYHLFDIVEERPTPWYRGGFAEFFCTLELKGDKLVVGRANPLMLRELQGRTFPSLERLFDIPALNAPGRVNFDNLNILPAVRAQGWALIHYFQAAQAGLDLRQLLRFELYLRSVRDNYDPTKAAAKFKELCGVDYPALQARLSEYVRTGRYQLTMVDSSIIPPSSTYAAENAEPTQMERRLAELLLRTTRSPIGRQIVQAAAAGNPPDARALEVLGNDALIDNDITRASEYWQESIDVGSTNPAILRELARFASSRWFRQFDFDFRLPDERADELRRLLQKSLAAAPRQQAAYELLAWVEASAGTPSTAALKLIEQRFSDLGEHRPATLLAVALAYARRNQKSEALRLLDVIETLQPTPALMNCVRISRERLAQREQTE